MLLIHRLDVTDAPHEGTPDNDVKSSFELDFFSATRMLRASCRASAATAPPNTPSNGSPTRCGTK
ncbi:hypothetical protein [Streptomyces sp. NPDC007070]|uniref:hypothetical protein n=1 Tax=Streptomyces sp. NPDC007070 TaxID=3154312 RepID=UPI0033CA93B4